MSIERVMCGTRLTYGNLVKDREIYGESNMWNTAHIWEFSEGQGDLWRE